VRLPTEELRLGVFFDIGQWLKHTSWTRYTVEIDGFEIINDLPQDGQLSPEYTELFRQIRNERSGIT